MQSLREFLREIFEDFLYFLGLLTKGDPDWVPRQKPSVDESDIRDMLEDELAQDDEPPSFDAK